MRIAIMQPYFFPYLGYFQLIKEVDLFVIYDCVQFARRGWVHRNKFSNHNGQLDWLTLPLEKKSRDVKIKDLEFVKDANEIFLQRVEKFPVLAGLVKDHNILSGNISDFSQDVVTYLINNISYICEILNINFSFIRSSSLNVPLDICGQDRIIEIAKKVEAKSYLNLPGGKDLYDEGDFLKHDIELSFIETDRYEKINALESVQKSDFKINLR